MLVCQAADVQQEESQSDTDSTSTKGEVFEVVHAAC